MDHMYTTGNELDLDIDLESGGTTSGDDNNGTGRIPSYKASKNLTGRIRSGFMSSESQSGCKSDGECLSGSYETLMISNEISAENKEQLGKCREDGVMGFVNKTNEEKPKHNYGNSCKPPRPPKGPSLDACDVKLMKEITVLNLKRKRMRRRPSRKIWKDKEPSWASYICPCLLTLGFLLLIIFQDEVPFLFLSVCSLMVGLGSRCLAFCIPVGVNMIQAHCKYE